MRNLIFIAMSTKGAVHQGRIRPEVLAFIAKLTSENPHLTFVAPMVQDYAILPYMRNTDATWEVWGDHCRKLIEVASEVWVLQYDGWDTSVGVRGEIAHADMLGVPVTYVDIKNEAYKD